MNKSTSLIPIGDRILVQPVAERELSSTIIVIPDSAKEKPQTGIVIALGSGKRDQKGERIPFDVEVGDRVLCSKYGGSEIKLDGEEYKLVSAEDIIGKFKK